MPEIRCSECGRMVKVQGLAATCPHCGNMVTVAPMTRTRNIPSVVTTASTLAPLRLTGSV